LENYLVGEPDPSAAWILPGKHARPPGHLQTRGTG
jgi:hypothetical protein